MSQEEDPDDAAAELEKLSRAEQRALILELMEQLSPEDRQTFEQLTYWLAFDRPNDELLTMEKVAEWFEDIKRENTRHRLGGRVGVILPFRKPGSTS